MCERKICLHIFFSPVVINKCCELLKKKKKGQVVNVLGVGILLSHSGYILHNGESS